MIRRFYVDNFKGLRDFTIDFARPLSVIAGPNGAGKTTICQALDLFFRLVRERPSDIMKDLDPVLLKNKWSSSSKIAMEADLCVDLPNEPGARLTWRVEIAKKKGWGIAVEKVTHRGADIVGNQHGDVLIRKWRRIDVYNHRTQQWERELKELPSYVSTVVEETRQSYPELFALQERLVFRYIPFLNPVLLRRRTRDLALGNQGENFAAYLHWFAENHRPEFQQMIEALREFFPSLVTLRPVRSKFGWTEVQVVQNPGGNGGNVVFKADQVNDGLLRLAALASLPHAEESLRYIAIEEPENGMHPRLLEHTLDLLRSFEGMQVILTTHSPVLLNFLEPEEAIVLSNRGPDGPGARCFADLKRGMKRLQYFDIGDVVYEVGEDRLMGSDRGRDG